MTDIFFYDGKSDEIADRKNQIFCDQDMPGHHVAVHSTVEKARGSLLAGDACDILITTTDVSAGRPSGLELQDFAHKNMPYLLRVVLTENDPDITRANLAVRYQYAENRPVVLKREGSRLVDSLRAALQELEKRRLLPVRSAANGLPPRDAKLRNH